MQAIFALAAVFLGIASAHPSGDLAKRAGVDVEVQATEQTVNKAVMEGCLNSMDQTQWSSTYQCNGGNFMLKMQNLNSNYQSPQDCYNTCKPEIVKKIESNDAVSVTCNHYANSVVGPAQSECWLDIWVQGNPEP